jgi:hypothetical protein
VVLVDAYLLPKVKANLILTHGEDDDLLRGYILAALSYAQTYQNKPQGIYVQMFDAENPPEPVNWSPTTEQAVIMLASHLYESRDGSTGGFFADSPAAARQSLETVDRLLSADKDWNVL